MPAPQQVFDGHNDTILTLPEEGIGDAFIDGAPDRDLDLPRIRSGGFAGGLFAVFVKPCPETTPRDQRRVQTENGWALELPPPLAPRYAQQQAKLRLDQLERLVAAVEPLQFAHSVADIREQLSTSTISIVVHFEGAEPIRPDLANLDYFYERGVRSLGLVWSRENAFAHGVPFEFPGSPDTGPGLKPAGRDLVRACNERDILIDLAHCNEQGFWDTAELSADPLVVSHGGVHDICPSTRNLTDEQLDAIAETDGLVGITFAASALRPDGEHDTAVDVSVLVDHIEYVADRVGVDHVALGSDFDGAAIIDGVGDVAGLPGIFTELRERGFDERERRKIASENWLRLLDTTWGA